MIQFRNVVLCPSLSAESGAFTADIYVGGKKAGWVENRGDGGFSQYRFDDKERAKEFEAYVRSLEPRINRFTGEPYRLWGEQVMDELFEKHLEGK